MVDCHSQRAWARPERNRDGGERTLIVDTIKRRSCIKALAGHWDAAWNGLLSPTLSHGMSWNGRGDLSINYTIWVCLLPGLSRVPCGGVRVPSTVVAS